MIEYYKDKDLSIIFNREPSIRMRTITPNMTSFQKHVRMKYPFENMQELQVTIFVFKQFKKYEFVIKKGYAYNGADIPRFLWRLIGSPTDNAFLIPSLIHDMLCSRKELINYDRKLSSIVFRSLLISSGVPKSKAYVMAFFVDVYQKFFCDWNKVALNYKGVNNG